MRGIIYKGLGLFIIFVMIIGGYGIYRFRQLSVDTETTETNLMAEATLPVVHTIYQGETISTLHGYTMDMNPQYMRGQLTPYGTDKTVSVEINRYDNHIASLSVAVMEMDGTVLEEQQIPTWETDGDTVSATVTLEEELETQSDYMLCVYVTTEQHGLLRFYSVLRYAPDAQVDSQIAFLKDFSDKLYDKEAAEELIPYIEPSDDNANDNLGHVDITSSFPQLTWADFTMQRVSEPIVSISDLTGESGSYVLSYDGMTTGDEGEEEFYHIREFFRICYNNGRTYLISYDRTVDQLFNVTTGTTSTSRLYLGIDSDLALAYQSSENNSYVAFVKERQLWLMDLSENAAIPVFSFYNAGDSDVRSTTQDYDIKIINLTDDGDLEFLVYGYQNRGTLEGKNGVALYEYNREKNQVEECVFLPSDRSYEILSEGVGEICYKTDEFLYIYLNESIYCVDMEGKSYVQLIPQLVQYGYCADDSERRLAWTDALEEGNGIRIMDLETGNDTVITPTEDGIHIPLGFLNDDLVYGTMKAENMVTVDEDTVLLLSSITIVDSNGEVQKEYHKKNRKITNWSVTQSMVQFDLVKKVTSNGKISIQTLESDEIISNEEQTSDGAALSTIVTDERQTELVLTYGKSIISSEQTTRLAPEAIHMDLSNALDIKTSQEEDTKYYVYGLGRFLGAAQTLGKAQSLAKENKGFVTDSSNQILWSYQEKFK